jgi:predicted PurR-regulated permease PerM
MSEGSPQLAPSPTHRAFRWAFFLGATAIVVYLCLLILGPFVNVIAWSAVLAIAFHPVHDDLVKRTGRVSLSAFISSVLVVMLILIPMLFLTALAINQFLALRVYVQETFKDGFTLSAIEPLRGAYEWVTRRLGLDGSQIMAWMTLHANELGGLLAQYSLTVAANITGVALSFIFTIFAMFMLFRDGPQIVRRIPDLMPFERSRSEAMLARIRDVIHGSVYGVVVIALIQGVLCGGMFALLGIPSAALWGMVTLITSVLPLVGAAAVWVPGTLYLLTIGHWPQAIVLAVWGGLVISSVDNFLRPRLVGGRVGLSELVMFFALLGGIQVFGMLGIVMGPVLFAVAASILEVLTDSDPARADVEAETPSA